MNWAQFKDPLCYLCLAGTVVASWSLTQKVAGLNNLFNKLYFLSLSLLNSVKTFRKNSIVAKKLIQNEHQDYSSVRDYSHRRSVLTGRRDTPIYNSIIQIEQ